MKINHTDITIMLDRSGSMQSIASDTIGGFNKFLEDQKAESGTADLTLNQFDDVFETAISTRPVANVPLLTDETFVPRGSTALLDAIGRSIEESGKRFAALPEDQRPERVIMVIITDGEENASKKFTAEKIEEMIRHQRETYKWGFVFLGANQDAIMSASKLGVGRHTSLNVAANSAGTRQVYSSLSSLVSEYRTGPMGPTGPQGPQGDVGFTEEDRREQEKAGAVTHK